MYPRTCGVCGIMGPCKYGLSEHTAETVSVVHPIEASMELLPPKTNSPDEMVRSRCRVTSLRPISPTEAFNLGDRLQALVAQAVQGDAKAERTLALVHLILLSDQGLIHEGCPEVSAIVRRDVRNVRSFTLKMGE